MAPVSLPPPFPVVCKRLQGALQEAQQNFFSVTGAFGQIGGSGHHGSSFAYGESKGTGLMSPGVNACEWPSCSLSAWYLISSVPSASASG